MKKILIRKSREQKGNISQEVSCKEVAMGNPMAFLYYFLCGNFFGFR